MLRFHLHRSFCLGMQQKPVEVGGRNRQGTRSSVVLVLMKQKKTKRMPNCTKISTGVVGMSLMSLNIISCFVNVQLLLPFFVQFDNSCCYPCCCCCCCPCCLGCWPSHASLYVVAVPIQDTHISLNQLNAELSQELNFQVTGYVCISVLSFSCFCRQKRRC